MKVGVNYAWKNYGCDFGVPPVRDAGSIWCQRAAWQATIDEELADFKRLGFFAVRWFVLGDGFALGNGQSVPHRDAGGVWRMSSLPPLSPEFLSDFRLLLDRFRAAGMMMMPVLVDFDMCKDGIEIAGMSRYLKQGRADVIRDPVIRSHLFSGVLSPLLELSASYRDVIYAWELMNEPEWCTGPNRPVPLDAMEEFIREGIGRINAAGFLSTVGFAHYDALAKWGSAALGVTLHQFHYYAEPSVLPAFEFDPRWPVIVGEIASAVHRPWPELASDQDLFSRLTHISKLKYPAAFIWASNHLNDTETPTAVDWGDNTRQAITRFTTRLV